MISHLARGAGIRLAALLLAAEGQEPDPRDAQRRTPLHVAAHAGSHAAMRALAAAGADPNALDGNRYDIVTIRAGAPLGRRWIT